MKNEFLYDFEVRVTETSGERTVTIGSSPNHEEAIKRALSCHKTATAAVVVRTVESHASDSTQLAELSESWIEVQNSPGRRFELRDKQGRLAASEFDGGHMKTAWAFLTSDKAIAAWKTATMLRTLRQAIREDRVNGRDVDLDFLLAGSPSRDRVRAYLVGARNRDAIHHGVQTF